jgi:alpha-ketoglutaric semialdehyde dehydrogenase
VVGRDADADASADALVAGAFSFAGQRCTAVRRAILIGGAYEPVIEATKRRVEALRPGDPRSDRTTLPPVRARSEAERIDALLERARADGAEVWRPGWAHDAAFSELRSGLPFVAPAVVESAAADSEIVQAESFGPVLVASRAADIRDAIERCNDVSQGLVASILSSAPQDVELFAAEARAGVLKLNGALAGAAPSLPFGGVGTSGAGPPEHGAGDADFYSRWQAVLA